MFAIPEPAKHVVHQEHKWGPGGLNPYTYKLLGSSLLEAINTLGGNTLSLSTVNTDDDDVSDFDLGSSVSGTSSIIDSGYESRESNSSGYVALFSSCRCHLSYLQSSCRRFPPRRFCCHLSVVCILSSTILAFLSSIFLSLCLPVVVAHYVLTIFSPITRIRTRHSHKNVRIIIMATS
jgi:hypothetical protein